MQTTTPRTIGHWIDGRVHPGSTQAADGARAGDVTNPATGQVTARVAFAGPEEIEAAVASARKAAVDWGTTSVSARTQVVFRFRELLNERKEELARIITSEHGKVHSDALGEVARGQEVVEFACGIPHLLKGGNSPHVSTGVDVKSIRQPLGVVGIISPFNFPAMVPLWFVPVAIACGNSVIIKPSEKDPSAVNAVAALWK
ncbi:MAG: aldehyde dehydrogenase family protein, partial [Nocardioidaceae bacterium]|nr:aldehyde dehydrogenase family protein [Nocardioidaceae bacterium]